MMRFRGWRAAAFMGGATALLTMAITGVAGEVGVRYRERHRTTLAGALPLLYYQHGRLGHAFVRGFDYFGWIHINHEGFRGPEVAVQKAPGVLRIMAVGSSTTFDPSVTSDAATWPARRRLGPGGTRRWALHRWRAHRRRTAETARPECGTRVTTD